ncbi:MAG: hypothetical protein WC824_06225 [Bacteroidota bacterium]
MKQSNRAFLDSLPVPTEILKHWAAHPPFPWIEVKGEFQVAPEFTADRWIESVAEFLQAPAYDFWQLIEDASSIYGLYVGMIRSGRAENDPTLMDFVRLSYQLILNTHDAIQHLDRIFHDDDEKDDLVVQTQIYLDPQTTTTPTDTQS